LDVYQAVEPELIELARAVRRVTVMATSENESPPPGTVAQRVDLRVRLDNGYQSGPVDGAWWPQSRDLPAEAVDLVENFPHPLNRIRKLLFSRPDWDPVKPITAHRIQTRRGSVELESFPSDDTHLMVITMRSGQRHRLLVIPSETPPDVAVRIMEEAADDRNTRGPAALLDLVGPDQSHIGLDSWNH